MPQRGSLLASYTSKFLLKFVSILQVRLSSTAVVFCMIYIAQSNFLLEYYPVFCAISLKVIGDMPLSINTLYDTFKTDIIHQNATLFSVASCNLSFRNAAYLYMPDFHLNPIGQSLPCMHVHMIQVPTWLLVNGSSQRLDLSSTPALCFATAAWKTFSDRKLSITSLIVPHFAKMVGKHLPESLPAAPIE